MGINEEEVLEPIPSNFVERAIYATKMREAQKRGKNATTEQSQAIVDNDSSSDKETQNENAAHLEKCGNYKIQKRLFKDINGNEYKLENGVLYVKTWKTIDAQVRIVKSATKKIVPLNGNEIQIFGWVRVDTDDSVEDAVNTEDIENGN